MKRNKSGIGGFSAFRYLWLCTFVFFLFVNLILLAYILSVGQKFNIVNKERNYLLEQISLSKDTLNNVDKLKISNEKFAEETIKEQVEAKKVFEMEKSYWNYSLTINGTPVTSSEVTVPAGKLTLLLKENEKERVLPLSMHNMGSITGGDPEDYYYNHVIFADKSAVTVTHVGDSTLNRSATYEFTATSGQEISITLTEILAERLKLPSKYLKLKVR